MIKNILYARTTNKTSRPKMIASNKKSLMGCSRGGNDTQELTHFYTPSASRALIAVTPCWFGVEQQKFDLLVFFLESHFRF
jgi:hypothetical protein